MPASAVVTVRIEPALLTALKDKARRGGQTVSAVIVKLVRDEMGPGAVGRRKPRRTIGMFADFEAPALDDMLGMRRELSRRLRRAVASGERR